MISEAHNINPHIMGSFYMEETPPSGVVEGMKCVQIDEEELLRGKLKLKKKPYLPDQVRNGRQKKKE